MYDFKDKEVTSFQTFSAFCFGCTGEGVKRRFLISNMSTGNIKQCHGQHVGHGVRVDRACFSVFACTVHSVELDWYPVVGVAGRRIQVALTKDRKRLPRRRR